MEDDLKFKKKWKTTDHIFQVSGWVGVPQPILHVPQPILYITKPILHVPWPISHVPQPTPGHIACKVKSKLNSAQLELELGGAWQFYG